jgi:hypothetical protein
MFAIPLSPPAPVRTTLPGQVPRTSTVSWRSCACSSCGSPASSVDGTGAPRAGCLFLFLFDELCPSFLGRPSRHAAWTGADRDGSSQQGPWWKEGELSQCFSLAAPCSPSVSVGPSGSTDPCHPVNAQGFVLRRPPSLCACRDLRGRARHRLAVGDAAWPQPVRLRQGPPETRNSHRRCHRPMYQTSCCLRAKRCLRDLVVGVSCAQVLRRIRTHTCKVTEPLHTLSPFNCWC